MAHFYERVQIAASEYLSQIGMVVMNTVSRFFECTHKYVNHNFLENFHMYMKFQIYIYVHTLLGYMYVYVRIYLHIYMYVPYFLK